MTFNDRYRNLTRRTLLIGLAAGSTAQLSGCTETNPNGGGGGDSGNQETADPYEQLYSTLQLISDPWVSSAEDIAEGMAKQMREQSLSLIESAANPIGLPADELIDIAAAFHAGVSMIQQGRASFNREMYRSAAKNAHSSDVRAQYKNLPVEYDNEKPIWNLLATESGSVKGYLDDSISESEMRSNMDALNTIFTLIAPNLDQVHEQTSSGWKLDEQICVEVDGKEACSRDGDIYFNTVRLGKVIANAMR